MSQSSPNSFLPAAASLVAASLLSACIIVDVQSSEYVSDGDYSSINDDLHVPAGQKADDLSSVNGDIRVGEGATADDIESVNGDIRLDEGSTVENIENVNGDIHIAKNARVTESIESVNGSIELHNASVAGNVEMVNGELELTASTITRDVEVVNADITLDGKSQVMGDVTVHKTKHGQHTPTITLAAGARIHGSLILERKVNLRIDPDASVGEIKHQY